MIVPDVSAAESKPVDFVGAFKLAGVVVIGLLALIGFGWEDLLGLGKDSTKSESKTKMAKTEDESEDSEKTYLDDEISDEALDARIGPTN